MYNLHLLDNRRLSTLSGTFSPVSLYFRYSRQTRSVPKRRILHSRRSRLESSSSFLSIIWLRFFCSVSSALELMQAPIFLPSGCKRSPAFRCTYYRGRIDGPSSIRGQWIDTVSICGVSRKCQSNPVLENWQSSGRGHGSWTLIWG
jgi:hypothetical protein